MAKALERDFYRDRKEEPAPRAKSEAEISNNMLLLQKLEENPEGLQLLLSALQHTT